MHKQIILNNNNVWKCLKFKYISLITNNLKSFFNRLFLYFGRYLHAKISFNKIDIGIVYFSGRLNNL
jgi:hypothetical protein